MSEDKTKKGPEAEEETATTEEAAVREESPEVPEETHAEEPVDSGATADPKPSEEEEGAADEQAGEESAGKAEGEEATEEPAAEETEAAPEEEKPAEETEAGQEDSESAAEEKAEGESQPADAEPAGEQAAEPATEEDEKSARMRWYVVHTYSGRENKVKDTIERMIRNSDMQDRFGKVLVATEEVAEMKKGKKKISQRKLFPSYILIEMEMSDEAWGMIENVPGVTHFVGEGKKPFPIPKKEVDRILGRMVKKEGVVPEVPYTIGEHVKVIDGPFTDFSGIVDEINPERGKLKVLVSIFGRETPVELDFLQVKSL